MSPIINLIGRKFGKLTVVGRAPNDRFKKARWECVCECGASRVTGSQRLLYGETVSCGCNRGKATITHGLSKTPIYKVWSNMLSRCGNPSATQYEDYGGRGIRVCESWQKFENFYADMGPLPSSTHSIDRENNDGNYELSNCRWATRQEQAQNTRVTLNLVGQVFGRLTVLERAHGRHWKCRCVCGTIKFVTSCNLRGKTSSCGCRKAEVSRDLLKAMRASHVS